MDRFAWFVDAGHLYAAGGQLCFGVRRRERIRIEFSTLIPALAELGRDHSGRELLRMYWYDAAQGRVPTEHQKQVAAEPGVKLRLGRLARGVQKGVDSLIVRDLMSLSANRAIDTAFLLSGDEDLLEGMIEAQDAGAKVILAGIPPIRRNQAEALTRDADDLLELSKDFLKPHFKRLS